MPKSTVDSGGSDGSVVPPSDLTTHYLRKDGVYAVPAGSGGGGSGTVTSVAAADGSIVVSGTPTTTPSLATGTLDAIAVAQPPAAAWSNNSKKITSLADGASAQDAAAFHQIPVADSTAGHFLADGVATAGAQGKWADSGHVHPNGGLLSLYCEPTGATGVTIPRWAGTTDSGALASGTLYMFSIGLPAGLAVNNITFVAGNTAETGGSHLWYVLCDSSQVVKAVTADQTGATFFNPNHAPYTVSVAASAYTTTYSGQYYVGFACVASSPPSLCGLNASMLAGLSAASPKFAGSITGQTTPPTTGTTIGALTTFNGIYYAYTS